MAERVGGAIGLKIDGEQYNAKGSFSYNLGNPKREGIIGSDLLNHGYKEEGQIPFIEGEITDNSNVDLDYLTMVTDATITLELGNGKIIMLKGAYFAGEGTPETEEGNIPIRFEGQTAKEVR